MNTEDILKMASSVEWRRVPGFPMYEASNLGDVRYNYEGFIQNCPKYFVRRNNGVTVTVKLWKDGWNKTRVTKSLGGLIWLTFTGQKRYVMHKNSDSFDNRLENLRVTH